MRFLGILFLLASAGLGAWDVSGAESLQTWQPSALGKLWYELAPGSLNMLQAGIQRYLFPSLWDDVVLPLLLQPGIAVVAVPGVVLFLLGLLVSRFRRRDSEA